MAGVGWVVYSGQWLQDSRPLGVMFPFLLGGLLLTPVSMCYAATTAVLPTVKAGSEETRQEHSSDWGTRT